VHCESRVDVVVTLGHFSNPGRVISVVYSRYQRTGEGQQDGKIQCVFRELSRVRNRARL
jgi:hypothetical protein